MYNMNIISSINNIIKYTTVQQNQEYEDPTSTPEIEQVYTTALLYFKFNGTTTNTGTLTNSNGTFTTTGQLNTYTADKTQTKGLYLRYNQNTTAKTTYRPFFSGTLTEMTFSVNYYPYDAPGDTSTVSIRKSPIYVKTQTSPDIGNTGRFGLLLLNGTQLSILISGSSTQTPANFPLKYNKWNSIIITYKVLSGPTRCVGILYIKNNELSYSTTFENTGDFSTLYIDNISNSGILLGRENVGSNISCPGYYVKLGFWDRVLTPSEITTIQNEFTT